ncbi:hypothetical protein L2E82_40034 [Cichorium intybus]|uniref:Uncharacterized protein n=1 Tax=Cichorium intybus TaxID=13427 RepID=A0ACB9AJ80_CICIN|nr:hypothetical protein L2E82_40034 [Cichorium intybus]
MASLVLLFSELLKHHDDAEFGYTSSLSRPSRFSGGPAAAVGDGGSCAASQRVARKSLRSGFGGSRKEDFVEDEPELRFMYGLMYDFKRLQP